MSALYGFAYTEAALQFLEKGATAKIRKQVRNRIDKLAANPIPPGSKLVQGVTDGQYPVRRVRQGKHRILYSIRENPDQIVILDIDLRKDVYR